MVNKYKHLAGLSQKKRVLVELGKIQAPEADKNPLKPKRKRKPKVEKSANAEVDEALRRSRVKNRSKRRKLRKRSLKSENFIDLTKPVTAVVESGENAAEPKTDQPKKKSKRRKMQKEGGKMESDVNVRTHEKTLESAGASSLRDKLVDKLKGPRFRFINEQLYQSTGAEAKQMFEDDPKAYQLYHEGYQNQVEKWPKHPLTSIISYLRSRKDRLIVADMGCGDAKLARILKQQHEIHSFDLVALNDEVTACDMAQVPLENGTADVCVFCLSLMGTNLSDYLREANRILKINGILKIAEIESRFASKKMFRRCLTKLGFSLIKEKRLNEMFVIFDFEKTSKPIHKRPPGLYLKPCLYKKR